ncbi:MAG TPA: winged helix-turn-helix domain-containing protein, partial [Acidobacteriota bacterium]|nr:winged helix-turn-helix domain-containing protein [Acidobacteriota bacterium]
HLQDFQIGSWKIYPEINTIAAQEEVRIEPQVMKVLCHLAENAGRVVSKEDLIAQVWEGRFVGDEAIANAIWELRRALGDDARSPTYIQTIPKRGYRMIAEVRPLSHASPPSNTFRESSAWSRNLALSAAAVAALLLTAVLLWFGEGMRHSGADSREQLTLAVLPFQDLGGEEYFGQGLSEALAGELARLPYLRVMASASSVSAAREQASPAQVAERLRAQALVQGTVQRDAAQVRLTLQLIDSEGGDILWSEAFQQADSRLPQLILESARETAAQLALHFERVPSPPSNLDDELQAMRRQPSVPRQAYEDYLRGLYFWKRRNRDDLFRAVDFFRRAVEQAPEYAAAYAGLAHAHLMLADHFYAPSRDSQQEAAAAVDKALRIDPQSAEALVALAWIRWVRDWDWDESERLFRQALRLNPSYATGHQWFAVLLEAAARREEDNGGREEAAYHAAEAQRLDVLSPIVHITAGMVAWSRQRQEEALGHFRRALQLDPDFLEAHKGLFWIAHQQGDLEAASRHCRRAQVRIRATQDWRPYSLAFQLDSACKPEKLGRKSFNPREFEFLAAGLRKQEAHGFVSPVAWLELHAASGHVDATRQWLEASLRSGGRHVFYLSKQLRSDVDLRALEEPSLKGELNRLSLPRNQGD